MIARLSFSQPSHLLSIAEDLAGYRGSANLRQTAMRRAVSNAYYAVFHALCGVCADGLVGRGKPDLMRTVYRSIDHGPVKRSLLSAAALSTFPDIVKIADLFASLQQHRHAADYEPLMPLFNRSQTLAIIEEARRAVVLIEQLDAEARLRLSILLVVSKRAQ